MPEFSLKNSKKRGQTGILTLVLFDLVETWSYYLCGQDALEHGILLP
jgi:hypothetical protein